MSTQPLPRRRASRLVQVSFLSATALAVPLMGCDDNPVNKANTPDQAVTYSYRSAAECVTAGEFSRESCQAMAERAIADYQRTAPRYDTREDCVREHGSCDAQPASNSEPRPAGSSSGGSHIMILNSGGRGYSPDYAGFAASRPAPGSNLPATAQPLIPHANGGLSTTGGVNGLRYGEAMTVPRGAVTAPASAAHYSTGSGPSRSSVTVPSARGGLGVTAHGVGVAAGG